MTDEACNPPEMHSFGSRPWASTPVGTPCLCGNITFTVDDAKWDRELFERLKVKKKR